MSNIKRRTYKPAETESESSDSDSDENGAALRQSPKKDSSTTPPQSYNYYALGVLFLFCMVPILTAGQFLLDFVYPEAANERRIYDNVYKCYNAVGDIDKLNNIPSFIKKYDGKEHALYNQLRKKYGMDYPECETFRMGTKKPKKR